MESDGGYSALPETGIRKTFTARLESKIQWPKSHQVLGQGHRQEEEKQKSSGRKKQEPPSQPKKPGQTPLLEKQENLFKLVIENPTHLALTAKLTRLDAELSIEESIEADNLAQLYFGYWANVQITYESGFLPESTYLSYLANVETTLNRFPYLAPLIERRLRFSGISPESSEIYAKIFSVIGDIL